ncbi:coiled-coil domain-containing protein 177 [Stigmatopora argus]
MVDPSEAEEQTVKSAAAAAPLCGGTAGTAAIPEERRLPDQADGAVAEEEGDFQTPPGGGSEPGPLHAASPAGADGDPSPKLHLDLYNFDSAAAEGSRYVLTSPRSLEACARCGVKPVELLSRPLSEFAREAPGRSMRVAAGLFEVYERERHGKLRQCREERERIVREEKRRAACAAAAAPEQRKVAVVRAPEPESSGTKGAPPFRSTGAGPSVPERYPAPAAVVGKPPGGKSSNTFPRNAARAPVLLRAKTTLAGSGSKAAPAAGAPGAAFPRHNGHLHPKMRAKSHSVESLQRRSDTLSSASNTCTSSDSGASSHGREARREPRARPPGPRDRTLAAFDSLLGRSLSLGDLSHSPQTTQKVERIVREVKRRGLDAVSERDRKIAALMLARYQEEDILSRTRQAAHLQWDSERRTEELRRERDGRDQRRAVQEGRRAWQTQVSTRQERLGREERRAAAAKMRRAEESEEQWRQLSERQERERLRKLQRTAREEKHKKSLQEQNLKALEEERAAALEQERLLLAERLSVAELKRQEEQHRSREERRGLNAAERRRHAALIREIARRERQGCREAELAAREKLSRSRGNYEHLLERRGRELRERARREEEQILRARLAADDRERQQRRRLEARAREAEERARQAALQAEERAKETARRASRGRREKERLQRLNRQRVEEEERRRRRELLQSIERKLEKSEQIFKEKRAVLESARSVARASFHVRDKVREETNVRTFDKMALEAQLKAGLDDK